jgi:hypothetical protein
METLVPLHGEPLVGSLPLVAVVIAAALGAATLLGLALAALVRRGSRPYLLIAGALAALLARSAVAAISMTGGLAAAEHHLLEHGLDVVLAALVIAAVYHARTVPRGVDSRP